MTDVKITHIEDSVSNVSNKQICIETGNDSQTGHRMWAGKDGAGNTYKFLGKGKPAYVESLNISDFSTAGLIRTDASGDIYGDVNTLGELNTALGGTTIDESTDPRDPNAHASTHEDSGADEIDVTGLSGLLADGQTPLAHGSTHEDGGSDEIDVTGLSGVLADAQTAAAHASTHQDSGSDALNAGDLTGTITSTSEKFRISNGAMDGSTDHAGFEFRDITVIKSATYAIDNRNIAFTDDNIVVIDSSDVVHILSLRDITGIATYSGTGYKNGIPIVAPDNNRLIQFDNQSDLIRVSDILNPSENYTVTKSFTDTSPLTALGCRGGKFAYYDNGAIYIANDDQTFSADTSFSYTPTATITSLDFSADMLNVYVADFPRGTSGSGYIKKIRISDGAVLATSSSIPTVSEYGRIKEFGDFVHFIHRPSSGVTLCTVYKSSDLTDAYAGSVTLGNSVFVYINGWTGTALTIDNSTDLFRYLQLPSLTSKLPFNLDGSAVVSSVFTSRGKNYSHHDWCNATGKIFDIRYNDWVNLELTGQFTVPTGTASGSYSFETPVILSTLEALPFRAEFGATVLETYRDCINTMHSGNLVYNQSDTADWNDTIRDQTGCAYITTVECDENTAGALRVTVTWDTTSRANDFTVKFWFKLSGHVFGDMTAVPS